MGQVRSKGKLEENRFIPANDLFISLFFEKYNVRVLLRKTFICVQEVGQNNGNTSFTYNILFTGQIHTNFDRCLMRRYAILRVYTLLNSFGEVGFVR